MTTPISATTASVTGATGSGSAIAQLSGNFSTFLTLLTTQLKNQDPLAPMDSSQFTQQLVQFSQVEQQINTNTSLSTLITQGNNHTAAYATSYLGKKVSAVNGEASLSGGVANWTYNLGTDAAKTQLTVTNAAGKVVYTGAGETASGNHAFDWDGRDNNGNALSDGAYKLTVNGVAADGSNVTTSVASSGVVTQIDMTGATPQLIVGNMELGLADIAAVAN